MEKWYGTVKSLQNADPLSDLVCAKNLYRMINAEIKTAKNKKPAAITLKMNSLSDEELIYQII